MSEVNPSASRRGEVPPLETYFVPGFGISRYIMLSHIHSFLGAARKATSPKDHGEQTLEFPPLERSRNESRLKLRYPSLRLAFGSQWGFDGSYIRLLRRIGLKGLLFIVPTVYARPVEMSGQSPKGKSTISEDLSATIISLLVHFVVGAGVLGAAHFLAKRHKATNVYGFLMANFAFAWCLVRADTSASLISQFTTFLLWLTSATHYGRNAFEKLSSIGSAISMIVVASLVLDFTIASYMHTTDSPVSVADLLSLSPAAVSLALGLVSGAVTILPQLQGLEAQAVN